MPSNGGNSKGKGEAVAIEPDDITSKTSSPSSGNGRSDGEQATAFGLIENTPAKDRSDIISTSTPANDIRSYATTAGKSVTGHTIPAHVHPGSHEMWITKDTPAEKLPKTWYHYDNGCRYGNAKVPHPDREYERQLRRHMCQTLDGQSYTDDHLMKAALEKSNYDKCLLIYRTHIARTIDLNKWDKETIKEHHSYEQDWPWALLPHPAEGWSAGSHEGGRECNICDAFSR